MDRDTYIDRTRRYLAASADHQVAGAFLAPAVTLEFPYGTYASLGELAAATVGRYRQIGKTHVSWDVAVDGDEVTVVSVGTLHGMNAHGVPFEGVRYIDRIVYRDGLIVAQQVWNDLAESGVLDRRPG